MIVKLSIYIVTPATVTVINKHLDEYITVVSFPLALLALGIMSRALFCRVGVFSTSPIYT